MSCEDKGLWVKSFLVSPGIVLRNDARPGDLGSIVSLHAILYAREYGFDRTFEAYVAAGVSEFASAATRSGNRLWVLENDGQISGSIAIIRRSPDEAQLRWFLLKPELRGRGLGRLLLDEALRFSSRQAYKRVFLWTVEGLAAAAHLYRRTGFRKTGEEIHPLWGKMIHEEKYELELVP